jgi:hypothetical protein
MPDELPPVLEPPVGVPPCPVPDVPVPPAPLPDTPPVAVPDTPPVASESFVCTLQAKLDTEVTSKKHFPNLSIFTATPRRFGEV